MKFFNLVVVFSIILASDQFIKGLYGRNVLTKRKNLKRETIGKRDNLGVRNPRPVRQTGKTHHNSTLHGKDKHLMKSLRSTNVLKMSANDTIVTLDSEKASFVEVLLKCAPIIKFCLLTSLHSQFCSLSCLFDPFPVLRKTVRVIGATVESICSPVGSVFDSTLAALYEHPEVKRISSFLALVGVSRDTFSTFSQAAADALPMQLIKYAKNPVADILKPTLSSISSVISGAQSGFQTITYLFNPICREADLSESVQKIAEALILNPFATDIILGGWFVLYNVAELRMGVLQDMFQSFMTTFNLVVGVKCSLIEFAETGKFTPCESVVGKSTVPNRNKKRHDINREVCGALPDLPQIDLKALLPDVFPTNDATEDAMDDSQVVFSDK